MQRLRREFFGYHRETKSSVDQASLDGILDEPGGRLDAHLGHHVVLVVLQSTYLTAEYKHFAVDPRMVTPWWEVIGRLVPTVRIQIISGVGHFPMLDAADAVNRCITTFLADATFRRFFELN